MAVSAVAVQSSAFLAGSNHPAPLSRSHSPPPPLPPPLVCCVTTRYSPDASTSLALIGRASSAAADTTVSLGTTSDSGAGWRKRVAGSSGSAEGTVKGGCSCSCSCAPVAGWQSGGAGEDKWRGGSRFRGGELCSAREGRLCVTERETELGVGNERRETTSAAAVAQGAIVRRRGRSHCWSHNWFALPRTSTVERSSFFGGNLASPSTVSDPSSSFPSPASSSCPPSSSSRLGAVAFSPSPSSSPSSSLSSSAATSSFGARTLPSSATTSGRGRMEPPQAMAADTPTEKPKKPLRVIISGAPASGKGTQCELIVKKFGLVHISAGDLLRAEVAEGTPNGKIIKGFIDVGQLVPDEVVNNMIVDRIKATEAASKGWLIDGYPRSASQAAALETAKIRPDVFILLEVPDELLVDRVVGRRSDPVTGKIYHMTYFPPETEEIKARLTQRTDDTEEKVKARLQTHYANVAAVLSTYTDVIKRINGDQPKEVVFDEISQLLSSMQDEAEEEPKAAASVKSVPAKGGFVGIPTKLNCTPHSREIRKYFYRDVCEATKRAVEDGQTRLQVRCTIPELNPELVSSYCNIFFELF
ncbi:hypothetical protein CBR_g41087 [Chara braunii]|uniref:adenylate kinase n=1 Tax=Chara braunii TaxID=69332 RepID=A0A388LVB8_CHABU|nr:hypothetical protein CBR_g41087 [Chara braunii]|eukprot:GBG86183.1 hypothetical protein CBR_g41087 [Chara braunii]